MAEPSAAPPEPAATPPVAIAHSESVSGSKLSVLVIVMLIFTAILLTLTVFVLFHWNYTLTATPNGAVPTKTKNEPVPTATPTATPSTIVAAPTPVAVAPAPAPAVTPEPVAPAPAAEKPTYVNLIVVDRESGILLFPVFEGVLRSSIKHDGMMTKFTYEGKPNTVSSRVLISDEYNDNGEESIGTVSCPDKSNPGKLLTVRSNQSNRNVYCDRFDPHNLHGLYYKTGSGIFPAPDQSNWITRPYSPRIN